MATCRKQKAIEEEDYDTAKAIKGQIADLRAGGARKTLDEVVIRVDATAHGSSQMSPDTPVTLPGEHPMPGSYPMSVSSLLAWGHSSACQSKTVIPRLCVHYSSSRRTCV